MPNPRLRTYRTISLCNRFSQPFLRRVLQFHCQFARYNHASLPYADPVPGPEDRIFVAMSGGVDSSFVAHLLASKYVNVTGVYMANWTQPRTPRHEIKRPISSRIRKNPERLRQYLELEERQNKESLELGMSCTETEWNDVREVCQDLNIPAIRLNLEKEYWMEVFQPMIDSYSIGRTPNPDVDCNRYIKFGKLYDQIENIANQQGESKWWLATGHYARTAIRKDTGQTHLLRPKDLTKDQTFYLATVLPSRLHNVLFPMHQYTKKEVRELAVQMKIRTAYKPDSQGLCFVTPTVSAKAAEQAFREGRKISSNTSGYRHFRDFLSEYIPEKEGNIVTYKGVVVGKHPGLWTATIGQRNGITTGKIKEHEEDGPWYVIEKRQETNEIVIAPGRYNKWLLSSAMTCSEWSWLVDDLGTSQIYELAERGKLTVRSRPLQDPMIKVKKVEDLGNGNVRLVFTDKAHGIAPDQYGVLYFGYRVLGGGRTESIELAYRENSKAEEMEHEPERGVDSTSLHI
ncbi:tRNA methyl transferase-domain-containing protein [Lipomyces tetrasporus]|uniref:tRNA-5-taurinomethyluridine 2-sulfurtransferase n=1 Tax=Lipomyces tetrasporus TaxID=54092 RepID=A0AAD7QUN9_9ASCO|nr:tRNA methyl transferase-domain-containing protein [Lipomyces tetrasporus]KAJ8101730.1 tRNA methyl transferase-domain-containing protein [Lipomyces tetrasporus]